MDKPHNKKGRYAHPTGGFQPQWDQKTNRDCIENIMLFTQKEGRAEQFEMVRPILMGHLWQALVANFGYPVPEEMAG